MLDNARAELPLFLGAGDIHWALPLIPGMLPCKQGSSRDNPAWQRSSAQVPLGRKASTPHLKVPGPALPFPFCPCPSLVPRPCWKHSGGQCPTRPVRAPGDRAPPTAHSQHSPESVFLQTPSTYTDALFKDFCVLPFKHQQQTSVLQQNPSFPLTLTKQIVLFF